MMRIRFSIALCAVWCLALAAGTASGQQPLSQAASLVRQGDYVWLNGNPRGGVGSYNQAYQLAYAAGEAPVLTILAERYLRLGYDSAAVTCYAAAVGAAQRWMSADPYRGQTYRYGFEALNHLINNWNEVVGQVPRLVNPDPARAVLMGWAQYASNVVRAAAQPVAQPTPPTQPRPWDGRGAGTTVENCDPSVPNSCDINRTPRNPR